MSVEPIEIHAYSPAWQGEFLAVGTQLRAALGTLALRIDHIGSTSIPGLGAKPIIDVQVSVTGFEPIEPLVRAMEEARFVWRSDNPELSKRYFRERAGARRTHVHVRPAGSWYEQFALLFRDYVREHEAERQRYEAVKRELADRFRLERQRYTDAKDPIIWEIMQRADRWASTTGWQPGSSDA